MRYTFIVILIFNYLLYFACSTNKTVETTKKQSTCPCSKYWSNDLIDFINKGREILYTPSKTPRTKEETQKLLLTLFKPLAQEFERRDRNDKKKLKNLMLNKIYKPKERSRDVEKTNTTAKIKKEKEKANVKGLKYRVKADIAYIAEEKSRVEEKTNTTAKIKKEENKPEEVEKGSNAAEETRINAEPKVEKEEEEEEEEEEEDDEEDDDEEDDDNYEYEEDNLNDYLNNVYENNDAKFPAARNETLTHNNKYGLNNDEKLLINKEENPSNTGHKIKKLFGKEKQDFPKSDEEFKKNPLYQSARKKMKGNIVKSKLTHSQKKKKKLDLKNATKSSAEGNKTLKNKENSLHNDTQLPASKAVSTEMLKHGGIDSEDYMSDDANVLDRTTESGTETTESGTETTESATETTETTESATETTETTESATETTESATETTESGTEKFEDYDVNNNKNKDQNNNKNNNNNNNNNKKNCKNNNNKCHSFQECDSDESESDSDSESSISSSSYEYNDDSYECGDNYGNGQFYPGYNCYYKK